MKILILFLALAIAHYAPRVDRIRPLNWLFNGVDALIERGARVPMIDLVVVLAVAVVGGGVLSALAQGIGGDVVWAAVALVVLVMGLGPRDLDRDVDALVATDSGEGLAIGIHDDAHQAGMRIYSAALARWFGVVFWFVVLGIPGVLLYRLTEQMAERASTEQPLDGVFRLRFFLEWPVLVLMVISSALTNDFDRVYQAWHQYRHPHGDESGGASPPSGWWIHRGILAELADAVLPEGLDQRGGVQLAHHFVWRMLILWLVVLSVLLLAGALA